MIRPQLQTTGATGTGPDQVTVSVRGLDTDMMAALDRYLQTGQPLDTILSVCVVDPALTAPALPRMAGRRDLIDDGLQFVPYFPFEPGTRYRARFTPPADPAFADCGPLSLDIRLPVKGCPAPRVLAIFPSGNEVPENILRFHVLFSESMRRGQARDEIAVLGPDGLPATDVLYRAPMELWNRDLKFLTVLLDPGRLKRGVGPNRQLGPPLRAGLQYTLTIGAGMTDRLGQRLAEPFSKHFLATDAVRRPIQVDQWLVIAPTAGSIGPLELVFPSPLDWGSLTGSIRVVTGDGHVVAGLCKAGRDERSCTFTPASPWAQGDHRVVVSSGLEDLPGNDLFGAFDRDLRRGREATHATPQRTIRFNVQ